MNDMNTHMNTHIKTIAEMILEDQCIIICGSDFSAIDNEKFSNKMIAKKFFDQYSKRLLKSDSEENLLKMSLPEISQVYIDTYDLPEDQTQTRIQTRVDEISIRFLQNNINLDERPTTTHLILANLGFRDIYTTNYDELIEKAYFEVGFPFINVINEDDQFHKIDHKGFPNVYKLCGTSGSRNITLAKKQFEDRNLSRLHYPFMRQILRKTIIFIGYNEQDDITLSPYVNFIKQCHPANCYCVAPKSSNSPTILNNIDDLIYIPIEIGEFISRLYIALLSYTSDCFDYLSKKRKFIEQNAIIFLKQENINISEIKNRLIEHQSKYDNVGNTWYYDYKFHLSLYESLSKKVFAKEFSEIYLKLRTFYSTYQTNSAILDHEKIYKNLNTKSSEIVNCLVDHLDKATEIASFWLKYINKLNKEILIEALTDYETTLESNRENINLKRYKKILVLGNSGTGKTTYSKRQAILSIATGSEIPIYVDFNSSSPSKEKLQNLFFQDNFSEFIIDYFKLLELPCERPDLVVGERLTSGKLLLIVDGFDRINPEFSLSIAKRIKNYHEEISKMKVIVTSRNQYIGSSSSSESLSEITGINKFFFFGINGQPTIDETIGKIITPPPPDEKRFSVALTFAGENRPFVQEVADLLSANFGKKKIFYDAYHEADLARLNLNKYLQEIYHDQSDYLIVFLCEHYSDKKWCRLEWRAINDLIMRKEEDRIILIKMGEFDVPGIFSTDGYLDGIRNSPQDIAQLIIERTSR